MNNETIKKFNIVIKLRGDNVYDFYLNNEWISSRGSCESILEEVKSVVKKSLIGELDNSPLHPDKTANQIKMRLEDNYEA